MLPVSEEGCGDFNKSENLVLDGVVVDVPLYFFINSDKLGDVESGLFNPSNFRSNGVIPVVVDGVREFGSAGGANGDVLLLVVVEGNRLVDCLPRNGDVVRLVGGVVETGCPVRLANLSWANFKFSWASERFF